MRSATANPPLVLDRTQAAADRSAPDATPQVLILTRALARGEEEAFRQFHGRYFDRLYRFLLVLSRGQEQEAEEALQDTLLRVVRYARPFDNGDAFWAWLRALARSSATDAGRKRTRYFTLLRGFALGRLESAPKEPDADAQLQELLEEGLSQLEDIDRGLLEGKYVAGSSVRELAADSALTEKAVESRLLRARRAVRTFIVERLKP